jgi:hypothetical protein
MSARITMRSTIFSMKIAFGAEIAASISLSMSGFV